MAACLLLVSAATAAAANFPFAPAEPFMPGVPCLAVGDFDGDGSREFGYDPGDGDACGTVGDFNGDGHLDLVTAVSTGADTAALRIKSGAGDGNFTWTPGTFGGGRPIATFGVGDVDGDGIDDVAVARRLDPGEDPDDSFKLQLFLGRADGLPQWSESIHAGTAGDPETGTSSDRPTHVLVEDLNEDGQGDLITATHHNQGTGILELIESDGAGGFEEPAEFSSGNRDGVVAGDLDQDGNSDLVVGGIGIQSRPGISVYFGDGDGDLQGMDVSSELEGPPLLGDFNGDGRIDIAAPTRGPAFPFAVHLNAGGRSFEAATGGTWPNSCPVTKTNPQLAADVDGDGVDDVIAGLSSEYLYRGDPDAGLFSCDPSTPEGPSPEKPRPLAFERVRTSVPQRLAGWHRGAAWFRVRCSGGCVVTAQLVVSERLRRDAGLKRNVVGFARYIVTGDRSRKARVNPRALRAILRVRPETARCLIRLRLSARPT